MPTLRSSSRSPDLKTDDDTSATPHKRRSRSDSRPSEMTRKSPRLNALSSPETLLQIDVLEKCVKSSLKLFGTPEKNTLCNTYEEKPIWDPRDVEHLRSVKEAMHVSTAPTNVVCREAEQKRILDFCKECIEQAKAGSLYICGCPGTGKSLSMEKVKESLLDWANQEDVEPPDVLYISCTSLTNTAEIFSKILGQKHRQKKDNKSASPLQLLQSLYSQENPSGKMKIVIADELDYLITKDRAVLHDLFMLTSLPFSKCILIGIANAIDLADRFIPKLQALNCKPEVIAFRAYSKDQILSILQERLKALPYVVFELQALELCARKVAAASGDMRKALSVCRRAIEIVESVRRDPSTNFTVSSSDSSGTQKKSDVSNVMENQVNDMVRINHVVAALSKTFKSPVIDTIQSLPQHQQIVLCSAVKLFQGERKGTTLGELNKYYVDLCKSTLKVPPIGIVELSSMCKVLDDQGILKVGNSREDKSRRVTLKVDGADIVFALQGVRFFRNCLHVSSV